MHKMATINVSPLHNDTYGPSQVVINRRHMHRRVTVVVLCVCVYLSVCYYEICCMPRLYVENKVS